MNNYQLLEV